MRARFFIVYVILFATGICAFVHLYAAKNHVQDPTTIQDVIIVGGGIGGLCAGIELSDLSPKIFQGTTGAGGILTKSQDVQNWPGTISTSGQDLVATLEEEATQRGCERLQETVTAITPQKDYFKVTAQSGDDSKLTDYFAKTILIATGTTPLKLNVPGEEKFWGKGVSSCAICDGSFFKGKTVAVIGGGDTALEEAQYLSTLAKKVYVVVRKNAFKSHSAAQLSYVTNAPNIEILFNMEMDKILGKDDHVTSMIVKDVHTGEPSHKPVDGIFEAIGALPNSSLLKGLVNLDAKGYVLCKPSCATNVRGIFAIGDVTTNHYRQAILSAQQAACAAASIRKHLSKNNTKSPFAKHKLPPHAEHASLQATTQSTAENCIVVGSGSTALAAAIYLGHAGLQPLVLEGPTPGGSLSLTKTLEFPWPTMTANSGEEIAFNLKKHAMAAGARCELYDVVEIDTSTFPYQLTCASPVTGETKVVNTKSILITTHRPINIKSKKGAAKDKVGFYRTNEHFETSIPYIFAAGSAVVDLAGHHIIGAGQGAETALNIFERLQKLGLEKAKTTHTPPPQKKEEKARPSTVPHLKTLAEFKQAITAGKNVMIDCFAQWCPPCKRLKPVLERIHKENVYPHILFYAVDVDEGESLAAYLGISSMPTLIFFKDGKEIKREFGFGGEGWLHEVLKKTFEKP